MENMVGVEGTETWNQDPSTRKAITLGDFAAKVDKLTNIRLWIKAGIVGTESVRQGNLDGLQVKRISGSGDTREGQRVMFQFEFSKWPKFTSALVEGIEALGFRFLDTPA